MPRHPSAAAPTPRPQPLGGGELDSVFQPRFEGFNRGLPLGELPLKLIDPGLSRSAVHGLGDLLGLAIKRLP
jgi:hypothetical protein